MISPLHPAINVMMSWLILPTIVIEIVFKRLPSFIYNKRPRYSPTRFGVLTEKDNPENTACNAVVNGILCIDLTDIFHLNASTLQFIIIKSTTNITFQASGLFNEARIRIHAFSSPGCCCIWWQMDQESHINNNGPRK